VGIYYKELESLSDFITPDAFARDWDGRHQCTNLGSAYSSLDLQHDNTVAFVYEEETYCGAGGGGYTIAYKNYSIEQLTDSAYKYLDESELDRDAFTAAGIDAKAGELTTNGYVGSPTEAGVEDFNAALDTYKANPTKAGYESINLKMNNLDCVSINPKLQYRIRNIDRQDGTLYLTATSETGLSVATLDKENQAQIWTFEAVGGTDYWTIKNQNYGSYVASTPAIYNAITLGEEAVSYAVISTTNGESKMQCLTPTNASYPYLHLDQDLTRIVPWQASSPSANAASFWYIEAIGPKGDANADGEISIADVTALVNYILGKNQSKHILNVCDLNEDGNISIADVTALVNIILNK